MSDAKSSKVGHICKACGKPFMVAERTSKEGKGVYCSKKCRHHVDIAERFWRDVDKSSVDGCWPYTSRSHNGYGYVTANGRTTSSHRMSWEIHFGPIPDGMYICHKCDNPPCVRPDHLFLGTPKDNMTDKHSKGRNHNQNGERNGSVKLSESDVAEIFRLYDAGFTQKEISQRIGKVSIPTVCNVLKNKIWGHLELKRSDRPQNHSPQKGESNNCSKLTEDDVREIFRLHESGMTNVDISLAIKKVGRTNVCLILKGRTWGHLGLAKTKSPQS
jgi:hypothetical protein